MRTNHRLTINLKEIGMLGRGPCVCVWLSACVAWWVPLSAWPQAAPLPTFSDSDEPFFAVCRRAQPITNWPLKKLLHAFPELKGLKPDESQAGLPTLLSGVAQNLDLFRREFPDTASVETIDESRVGDSSGSVGEDLALGILGSLPSPMSEKDRERFRYLVVPDPANQGLTEYRTDLHGHRENMAETGFFVKTLGFVTLPFLFTAESQRLSDFRYLGSQAVGDAPCQVVAFAEHAEPQAVRGRLQVAIISIPLILQGVAWIDPAIDQIIRIRADLLAPQPHAGLRRMTTLVVFGPIKFQSRPMTLWLPQEVYVALDSNGYLFENHHKYSDYQLFKVETQQSVQPPKAADPNLH